METSEFTVKYEYIFLEFANYVGQFISRSNTNIMIMQVPFSMSLLQTINLLFMVLNVFLFKITDFSFMFIYMIYVGYIGGSVYLNTFFLITQKRKKEIDVHQTIKPVA